VTFRCPACQRSFNEPGFCPYDGKQLVELELAQKPTVVSEMMPVQDAPTITDSDTLTERRETEQRLPRAASAPDNTTNKVRAISAHQSSTTAIDTMRKEPAVSEYDRLVGETLDNRYYVQRKIGEGGMGVVFAARHAVIERPLAIKVLKREVMRDTATIKRFVQEAKAASRIGHPNIVDVTDFGTTPDGMTFSVMEYVDGTTLSRAIKEQAPFPPERSIHIAMQIARALGAAHDKGIVHRDLKPENVFLINRDDRPDFVKIVDFGIAKVQPLEGQGDPNAPRLTRAGSVFGTPEYMAPEQAAGRSDTDRRVDIYALGTILYEMTCGRTPHKSDSTVRTIAMQMLDPIMPPSQVHPDLAVPKPLELVIMKALAKKREERYQTMAELIAALDGVTQYLKTAGSTMSLPPLPPGADPNVTPTPAVPLRSGEITAAGAPRRAKPETRPLHEPAFAAATTGTRGRLTLPEPIPEEPVAAPRRWPYALVAALLLAGGGGAWWLLQHRDDGGEHVASAGSDAAVAADARVVVELSDATVDAADVVGINLDGGVKTPHRDGGVVGIAPHPKLITVEILTRPGEANVFNGHEFVGPNGVHVTRPWGTKLELECRAPHYKGKVAVTFDGARDAVMCTATRLPFCVEGLKNPIDDCEERPPAP
jgi:tRNA A-37 threonylcarbamoyl transferase component Bud32